MWKVEGVIIALCKSLKGYPGMVSATHNDNNYSHKRSLHACFAVDHMTLIAT
jgi:hypothetical protein